MDVLGWIDTGLTAVGGASLLAAILPRPSADSRLAIFFRALDLVAANWLNARNSGAPR
jgi:hypothetical protein